MLTRAERVENASRTDAGFRGSNRVDLTADRELSSEGVYSTLQQNSHGTETARVFTGSALVLREFTPDGLVELWQRKALSQRPKEA